MAAVQPVLSSSLQGFELKHILVTTDFSDCSRNALKQAAAIARLHGSDLLVLHVVAREPMEQNTQEPPKWEWGDIVHQSESEMASPEVLRSLAGVAHETILERGELEQIVTKTITEREVSLLVLGTHGRSGLKRLLMGSVAEEIFRIAECPVLTAAPHEPASLLTHGTFQSVLFATDFASGSMHALSYAAGFAHESKARLTLLHVVEESSVTALYMHERLLEESRKRMQELLPANGQLPFPIEVEIVNGFPADEILRIADKKQADLIVMGVHKSSGLGARTSAHLPWGTAQTVVHYAKCPVLTVRG